MEKAALLSVVLWTAVIISTGGKSNDVVLWPGQTYSDGEKRWQMKVLFFFPLQPQKRNTR